MCRENWSAICVYSLLLHTVSYSCSHIHIQTHTHTHTHSYTHICPHTLAECLWSFVKVRSSFKFFSVPRVCMCVCVSGACMYVQYIRERLWDSEGLTLLTATAHSTHNPLQYCGRRWRVDPWTYAAGCECECVCINIQFARGSRGEAELQMDQS